MIKQAFILAAGLGTRMGEITATMPKPMISIKGKTLISMIVDQLVDYGIEKIVINTFYKAELLEEHLIDHFKKINFKNYKIIKEEVLLETGGGIVNALPYLDNDPFFVVNGDGMWAVKNPFDTLNKSWSDNENALFLLVNSPDAKGHDGSGDFNLDSNNNLSTAMAPLQYVYASVHITKPSNFKDITIEKKRMMDIYSQKFKNSSTFLGIRGLVFDGVWFHISTPSSIEVAKEYVT